ncbi:MAG: Dabb family protein [Myxococcota bacterium]|nr:Dabb family protein [Myxococcota bacterium]
MIRQVALLTLRAGCTPARLRAFEAALDAADRELGAVSHSQLGRHLAGSLCGDYTWDVRFAGANPPTLEALLASAPLAGWFDPQSADCVVADTDAVRFAPQGREIQAPALAKGIKRTLLLRVAPTTPPEICERFERDIQRMPGYVAEIRNWAFSRTDSALHATDWTHVWEQEYDALDGLQGAYMLSPFHWGYIDGWFDPEFPQRVVEDRFAHVFCGTPSSVLAWE